MEQKQYTVDEIVQSRTLMAMKDRVANLTLDLDFANVRIGVEQEINQNLREQLQTKDSLINKLEKDLAEAKKNRQQRRKNKDKVIDVTPEQE
jgi:hypothetical protein